VLERALCPTLVGRDEQLFVLEDALLAAHRGESRFVALGGEAGMGKTRLATELARRAQRLGWEVLWGACSEAELPLPYLPFVEALGNYLSGQDAERLAPLLGAGRRELAQLFPLLGTDEPAAPVGDPAQAKLRLFEAVVALLGVPAHEHGVLLVVEDVHWADSATRELLDHLARRLTNMRSLLLVTYRSDELDRRHPLAPLLLSWRRSGVTEQVTLSPLRQGEIGEMIAAILGDEEIGPQFGDLMHARTEGNPFVLEEMLKEAIDRSDVFRSGQGWQRRSLDALRIPETVRDTILLRFGRLDPAEADVLQAAAVLGRTFDYDTLVAVAGVPGATVQGALAVGVAQQLLEELADGRATYRWRHALTQEAVVDEIVLPRRQEIHGRAADALVATGAGSLQVARHLLGAARFDEAVPVCLAAAEEAEASFAFAEALELLDRALPHVHDPLVRSRLLCRMGRVLWMDGKTSAAEQLLAEGVPGLEAAGEELEAARYRLVLGRCRWEQSRPDQAREEFERARRVLEQQGPSAELAVAYIRLAGLYKFELDPRALETIEKAVDVARAAGADFERVWAMSWLALALLDEGRAAESTAMLDESFEEARRRGFSFIAHNIAYNDAWNRLHTMAPGMSERIDALASEPGPPVITDMIGIATSWALRVKGDLPGALAAIERAHATSPATTNEKTRWRTRLELAEVLLELGRLDEASAALPDPEERAELQDIVYDAAAQIRLRLAFGRVDDAVELAREIREHIDRLAAYRDTLSVAVEAFVAAGLLDEAQAVVAAGRAHPTDAGTAFLDEAQGRILLARGEAAEAAGLLARAGREAAARGYRLVEWRGRPLAAEAVAHAGSRQEAEDELASVVAEAAAVDAVLVRDSARAVAERLGLAVPEPAEPASIDDGAEPEVVQAGERLVTSMFADVRGYTALAADTAPAELAERLETLHRWASAEVGRHHGFVDKFAGDAVMATFNATGSRLDHAREALEAALALSGKAALLDLGIGVGIAVGPAVVGRTAAGGNVSVLGTTTNLAARLQAEAKAGEIVLSDEAHRRVADWLAEHGLEAAADSLELKGFDGAQPAWRLRAGATGDQ
jgi:class 3 adenylate cyclase/predicted negative regulator of RcsB-dependent stress response